MVRSIFATSPRNEARARIGAQHENQSGGRAVVHLDRFEPSWPSGEEQFFHDLRRHQDPLPRVGLRSPDCFDSGMDDARLDLAETNRRTLEEIPRDYSRSALAG